jgi:2-aminoethylphosphonate-pyruvate transaminase
MSRCTSAVILAAGLGSRLGSVHGEKPKGFISIGGEPIVRRSIRLLINAGVTEITIVTGHLANWYEDLKRDYVEVDTVHNPQYADSGSMYSLWCARNHARAPFLLVESDLIYEPRALSVLQESGRGNAILLSGRTESGDEVYVETEDDRVLRMSKNASTLKHIGGELVGISKISADLWEAVLRRAEQWFVQNTLKLEYEHCVNDAIAAGSIVQYEKVDDLAWTEIDDAQHLNRARTQIFPAIHRNEAAPLRIKRNILLNPGPATTTDSVKRALVVPDICHREREFLDLTGKVHLGLVDVVSGGDGYAAVTCAGSGTAAVEAVIGSVTPRNKKILIVENGAYGTRMRQIAQTLGIDAVVIECSAEATPSVEMIEAAFSRERGAISHLAIVHHETTTGLLNPVKECAVIAKRFGAEVIVDAMSSYAGIPMDVREWRIDYLISSANKCLQGMPGISFAICSRAALEKASAAAPRSVYLNVVDQYRALSRGGEARFTPPVQLFYGLSQALNEYFDETGARRHARYVACYDELLAGMKRLGFAPLLPERLHSKLLTAFMEPQHPNYSFDAMHDDLYAAGFTIYPGKIASRKTFRIANIGAIDPGDIRAFLRQLEKHLRQRDLLGVG